MKPDIVDLTNLKPVMTLDEAAKVMRCSAKTVSRMIRAGQIKGFRVGERGVRVTRREILRYINLDMDDPRQESPEGAVVKVLRRA